jgi:hypothetical protein
MTKFYVQRKAGVGETAGALAVALGVGGLSFYLVRMLLAREGLESQAPPRVAREPGPPQSALSEGTRR